MSRQSKSIRAYVLATSSAAALAGVVAYAPAALAQDEEAASTGERIVVTGSRIQRRDFQANSPIVTVDTEAFENQTGVNVESYLNRLPQFNPALTPELGNADVQPTAVNSVGIATLSLRGLGANRNLVLVDGKRQVPINALMVTDVNSIPSALIQRVEIITGGASAVYGADAVGGVVNFILRDNFEGLELDAQYGMTEVGDGEQFRISAIMGANTADGRGNVTAALEHYSRSAALQSNRDFYTDTWADPWVGTNEFFTTTHGAAVSTAPPNRNAVNAIFDDRAGNICGAANPLFGYCAFSTFNFNTDGTVWTPGNGSYRFSSPVDGREHAYVYQYDTSEGNVPGTLIQSIKSNNEFNYVSSPQDRYAFYASGHYDVTDSIEFFGRANFAESDTATRLFPSPAITGWAVNIPYNPALDSPVDPSLDYTNPGVLAAVIANPAAFANPTFIPSGTLNAQGRPLAHFPVTTELAILLNSRATNFFNPLGNAAPWQLSFIPDDWFDDRSTVDTNTVWQLEAGFRGDLAFRDWNWEAFVTHGESSTYNVNNGNFSLQRYQAMVAGFDLFDAAGNRIITATSPWDYGRNAVIQGNPEPPNTGFGAATGRCTTGFYDQIFFRTDPSEDCEFAVNAELQGSTRHQQNIAEINLQGSLFELPAGEVRSAIGVQYRENAVQYNPDILQSTASFIDQVVGVYPTAYMDASTYSEEAYAEALIPVLANLPLIQEFSLELGGRYSNYAQSDDEWTYKALADWAVTDWLRLRGGYNRATRAPNIGELFLGRQQFFGFGSPYGDPCAGNTAYPYGASGAVPDPGTVPTVPGEPPSAPVRNANGLAGATSTFLICQAQMTPAGAGVFYANDFNTAGLAPAAVFAFQEQEGNPNLDSEKGDTWTFGGVFTSPFDNPWLSGLTATVDWYSLEVSDAIQQQTIDQARFGCYGTAIVTTLAEAQAHVDSGACDNVVRRPFDGAALNTLVSYSNQAHIETSGVDVNINWQAQFEDLGMAMIPGGLGVNVQYNWLDYYRTRSSDAAFDLETDWTGSLGPTLQGTNAGAYEYRLFTTLNYFVGPGSVSLRWRHLPEVDQVAQATDRAIIENNIAVAAGAEGLILPFTPTTAVPVKKYDIFDLSANWQLTDLVAVRAGVDNLFDTPPVRVGESTGYSHFDYTLAELSQVCANAGSVPGCTNPGNFSLPVHQTGFGSGTSAGFYDVIGRRFFVGLKLTY